MKNLLRGILFLLKVFFYRQIWISKKLYIFLLQIFLENFQQFFLNIKTLQVLCGLIEVHHLRTFIAPSENIPFFVYDLEIYESMKFGLLK